MFPDRHHKHASRRDDSELARVPAQDIDELGALVALTSLVDRAVHQNERHARPRYRLADRRGINRIGLAALDIGLHVVGRHQHRGVPSLAISRPQ